MRHMHETTVKLVTNTSNMTVDASNLTVDASNMMVDASNMMVVVVNNASNMTIVSCVQRSFLADYACQCECNLRQMFQN